MSTRPSALISELICAELAHWFGLAVPPFAVIRKCEIKLRMRDWRCDMEPPLFFSKAVDGIPRDGSDTLMSKLRVPMDVAKLVIFDTWVRNADRYNGGVANSDNLLFVRPHRQRRYNLVPIDHTHCFVEIDFDTSSLAEPAIFDPEIYGNFPEFKKYMGRRSIATALEFLSSLDRDFVVEIINSVPPEWGLGQEASRALTDFICRRAKFVVDSISVKLVDDPELPGIN